MRIGLVGLAGSGKSEVARVLTEEFDFVRVKFADPLKNMLRTMLADIGHTAEDVERYLEGDLKEGLVDGIGHLGATARHLMQTLGTEWGRNAVHPDLWMSLWAAKAERFAHVVADDVRFENEVAAIRAAGGKIIKVVRDEVKAVAAHVSEELQAEPDLHIYNSGTLDDLRKKVRYIAGLLVP